MYQINIPSANYSDPWKSSFEERYKILAKGQRRVAYYYENPDSSTFRYRVYNMIRVLQESKKDISAAYFQHDELASLEKVVDLADVLVICRTRYSDKLNRVITKARNKGKKVFFDIDDLVYNTDYIHLILDTLDQDFNHPNVWDFWFAYVGRIGAALNLCDQVITTNPYLATLIQNHTKKLVSIIPNFLNQEQIEISKLIFQEKKARGFARSSQIHLGYFSGTPTHNKDLQIVSDALVSLLEKYPRVIIRIVGYMDIKGVLQNYSSRIERFPIRDFINLQRLIGEVEVNLVPLQDNEFINCKSELKYFEAGIAGTVTVASPTFTYTNAIRNGDNGFLSKSFEWARKLEYIVDGIDNCTNIIEKAFNDSIQKYAWYNQIGLVEKTLFPDLNQSNVHRKL
jgi:glycosyltransferase involved in cell wall biosynthesis